MKIVVLDTTAITGVKRGIGSPAYFSRFAIEHLMRLGHDVMMVNGFDPDLCDACLRS